MRQTTKWMMKTNVNKKETKKTKEEISLESKDKNKNGVKKEIKVIEISSNDDDEFYCNPPLCWEDYHKEESVSESKEDALELYCDIGRPMLV